MSLGEILKTAREQRALSTSSAAEATHMKVQIIEDLENEDFRRIAAPIYGRGFVKLYAEFLELDAAPLIREFMDLYSGKRAPVIGRRAVDTAAAPAKEHETPVPVTRTVSNTGAQTTQPLTKPLVRTLEPAPAPDPDADEPLTLTPCLTPTHAFAAVEPQQPIVQSDEEVVPPPESVTEEITPSEKRWVVEPEVQFADPNGEPDLFSQHIPQRQSVTTTPSATVETPKKKQTSLKRSPGSIFDMGRRLDSSPIADTPQDAKTTARQHAHLKTFVDSFKRLGTAALNKGLSDDFFQQYRMALIVAGVFLLICMLTGVSLLFSKSSNPIKEISTQKFQQVAPIPDLYAD